MVSNCDLFDYGENKFAGVRKESIPAWILSNWGCSSPQKNAKQAVPGGPSGPPGPPCVLDKFPLPGPLPPAILGKDS